MTATTVLHTSTRSLAAELEHESHLSHTGRPVLAAVSGFRGELSGGTVDAVRWAAAEAVSRHVPLRVVSVVDWRSVPSWSHVADDVVVRELSHHADAAVRAALSIARASVAPSDELSATGAVVRGEAASALARLGHDAGSVVVGTRHLPWVARSLLGSVGAVLAASAPCPVIIVAGGATATGEVVVGVDEHSEAALQFAAEYAQRRGLGVHALFACAPIIADEPTFARDAQRWLGEAVAGVRADHPDVSITTSVHLHHPVQTLLTAAEGQHLLVVGRSGRSRHPSVHVGSVGQGLLHHASCPVAVVPEPA